MFIVYAKFCINYNQLENTIMFILKAVIWLPSVEICIYNMSVGLVLIAFSEMYKNFIFTPSPKSTLFNPSNWEKKIRKSKRMRMQVQTTIRNRYTCRTQIAICSRWIFYFTKTGELLGKLVVKHTFSFKYDELII